MKMTLAGHWFKIVFSSGQKQTEMVEFLFKLTKFEVWEFFIK